MNSAQWATFRKILKRRLIFALGLLAACFVATQWVIPHFYKPSAVLNLTDVSERQLLRLRKNFGDGYVHALKIRIRGELDGTAKIRLFDSVDASKLIDEKMIGLGKVDERMGGDWYLDECRLEYDPISAKQGGLKIDYYFDVSGKKKGAV